MRISLAILLSLCVIAVPQAQSRSSIPTPESVFGFAPGADYKLATYDQSIDYFKKLAAASQLHQAGRGGQDDAGPDDVLRAGLVARQPGEDRSLPRDRAAPGAPAGADRRRGARSWRAKARRSCTSTAACTRPRSPGPQHTPLLAYDLVSQANEPATKAMLDNVILMLWPTINPDGQQMVAEWYMKNVGTPYELSGLPQLYQEYVGHDNNRDAYMLNMIESRVIEHTWRQWEPQIIYVHHQSGRSRRASGCRRSPSRSASTRRPIMSREVNMIGMAIAKGLEEQRPGRRHAHGHGVRRLVSRLHRLRADLQEHRRVLDRDGALSSTRRRTSTRINDFPQNMRDLRPQSLYSSPWPPGWWRLRDAVDYMETASLVGARVRVEVQGLAAVRTATRPAAIRSRSARRRRRTRTSSRRSSAIRSPPSSCCAGWRSAACACRS